MIVFELTMPNRGSWNGKWSQEHKQHFIFDRDINVPNKEVIGKDFSYNWDDGWTACVHVSRVNSKEVNKLRKINSGFCGYDWMVNSIKKHGKIIPPSKEK